MSLVVFGVRHSDRGVAAIQEAVSPYLQEGGLFDTVYSEVMNIPPLTDCTSLGEASDEYDRLLSSVGQKVLSIDGCLLIFDATTLRIERTATLNIQDAADGIRTGKEVDDRLYLDIGRLIRIHKERDEMMANQLIHAHEGIDQNDAVFLGAQHRPVVDHLRQADIPASYVDATSPMQTQIIEAFFSFYGQDPFDINSSRFATLYMITIMAEGFSPEQANRKIYLSEANLDEVYQIAVGGYGINRRTTLLDADTVFDILSQE